ncbi:MAG: T9SS type A sorting domain-containing protein, partial [Bacteroidia bacterium]|nr:T9SS type A sorting domain-containing protein [Bacteroidia bacterium]
VATINAGGPLNFCAGDSVMLTSSSSTTYLWSNGNTNQSITVYASGTYSVTLTNAFNCSATSSAVTVTAVSYPVITASADMTLCANTSVNLSASGASSYVWSPSTYLNNAGVSNPVSTPSSSISYTVIGSNSGCADTAFVNLTVNPAPFASAGSDITICQGQSGVLSATGTGTLSWSPATNLTCTNCLGPFANPAVTTIYNFTVTDSLGCQNTDAVVVNVNLCTQIEQQENNSLINVYPNPTTGNLIVELREKALVQLFDVSGQLIYEKNLTGNSVFVIPLAHKAAGIYFLKVTGNIKTVTQKIIKE